MEESYKAKPCKLCGKLFHPRRAGQRYCSTYCQEENWRKVNIPRQKEARRKDRVCKSCGAEFRTSDSRKLFCTPECRLKFFNDKRDRQRVYLSRRPCKQCGENFMPRKTRGREQLYCSKACMRRAAYVKSRERSQRHAEYRKKYKMDGNWWKALQRDDFTCQICNKQLHPSQWNKRGIRKLVVHHLDGTGEHEEKNHDLSNLLTVCDPCHRLFHTKVNVVYTDGKFRIDGAIFEKLGVSEVEIN